IPGERWEDATLSGASWMRTALDVVVPALRPLLLAITMLLIGLSLGTFDAVLILTGGGPGTSTVTPALYSYNQAFGANNWPLGAAILRSARSASPARRQRRAPRFSPSPPRCLRPTASPGHGFRVTASSSSGSSSWPACRRWPTSSR